MQQMILITIFLRTISSGKDNQYSTKTG